MVYYIYWLAYVEPSLYLRDKANLVIVDNHFDVHVYSVCNYFIEHFNLCSSGILVFSVLFCCCVPGLGITVTLAL